MKNLYLSMIMGKVPVFILMLFCVCSLNAQTTFTNATNVPVGPGVGQNTSAITVTGMGPSITLVTVNIPNITHTWFDDIDFMLVSPTGGRILLMSDCGGGNGGTRNYTFTDAAATNLADATLSANGSYRPTDYVAGEILGGGTATMTTLAGFNGTNPNGVWTLYAADDATGDGGTLTGGWSITITAPNPQYKAQLISMNTGSVNWCAGETRNVSITLRNIGTLPWTDAPGVDFNVGVKWNADLDYFIRVDAQNLAPNTNATYTFSVTAPMTTGSNNLSFDVVREGCFWFANNSTACGFTAGPGNVVFTSAAQNIKQRPVVNAGVDDTICPIQVATLNGSATGPTVFQTALSQDFSGGSLPVGWSISSDGAYNPNVIWRHSAVDNPGGILTTTNANGYMNVDSDWWYAGSANGNAYLTMPSINLSSYSSVNFSMSHYYRHFGASSGTLQMSLNGGGAWTNITVWNVSTANAENYSISIPAAAGQSNVIFRFRYNGSDDWYWAVDDIVISGNALVPITYTWTPSPMVSNPSIPNPTTNPIVTTNYTLTATADGCSSSDLVTVVVEDCSGLPVELSTFSSSCANGHATISWATESEINCDYFLVETSRDGQDWGMVTQVPGAGNSQDHIDYSIVDENAITGISYYRLKQVDHNGSTKIYGPILLNCESSDGIILYPNPAHSSFVVQIQASHPDIMAFSMRDATGKLILEKNLTVKNGTNQFPIEDLSCRSGVYFVSITKDDGTSEIMRIVIE